MDDPVPVDVPWLRAVTVVLAPLLALLVLDLTMDPIDRAVASPGAAVPGLLFLLAMGVLLLVWSYRGLAGHPARDPLFALGVAAIALPWSAWLIRLVVMTYAADVDLLELAFTEGGWYVSGPVLLTAIVVMVQVLRRRTGWLPLADTLRGATGATAALVGGYFLLTVSGQAEKAETAHANTQGIPWVSPVLLAVALALLAWRRRRA